MIEMVGVLRIIFLFLLIAGILTQGGMGQDNPGGSDIFASDSLLEITLLIDIDSIRADVGEDPSYHDGTLTYTLPGDGTPVTLDLDVRARGSFRKRPENCDFPPLKFRFKKADRQGTIFEQSKELKVVTHCQSDIDEFEQYVVQEYLIYRGYNLFTDFSLRARLARITYVDLPEGSDSLTRFALLLEDAEDMAERNQAELLELESAPSEKLDQYHLTLMSLYNYMILNTDYSVPIVHNIELVSYDHFKPPVPVPYDFDWSGIINIPYDSPYATSRTRYSVRTYKGPCVKRKYMKRALSELVDRRRQLFTLYKEFPYLELELKSRSMQELNMFYVIIGNRSLVKEEIIKNCID
jgi:hypothetical protein